MKKVFLACILLVAFLLTSCVSEPYSQDDKKAVIDYIQENGFIQYKLEEHKNLVYLDLGSKNIIFESETNYLLYCPECDKVGVCFIGSNYSNSIMTDYVEVFGFFEAGKPWEADYELDGFFTTSRGEKESLSSRFKVKESSFDKETSLAHITNNSVYAIRMNITSEYLSSYNVANICRMLSCCFNLAAEGKVPRIF